MLAGSTFPFICGYFTPQMGASHLHCASPGPLCLTVFVSLLWVTFFGHRVRFLCLFGAFLPFQGCVNKSTSFCRVALCDRVIGGFIWFLSSPGPPCQSPGPPELLAAALRPLPPPLHLLPLSPLSAQGLLASLQWVDTEPGSSWEVPDLPSHYHLGGPQGKFPLHRRQYGPFLAPGHQGRGRGIPRLRGGLEGELETPEQIKPP